MHLQTLDPAAQALAMARTRTPTPFELFSHQARVLHDFGLCSASELEFVVANHVPQRGPFVYIPSRMAKPMHLATALANLVAAARGGVGLMDLKHEPSHANVPLGGYFVTGYEELGLSSKISAAQCDETFVRDKRYGLTVLEVGFTLLYFPAMFDKAALFAATGSTIKRGEKEEQVPLWHLRGGETVALDSFYRSHQSAYTLFPSCERRVDAYRCH